MKTKFKILSLVMFVMLICCVSAASATDVDNITVPDDTSVIEVDDIVDSVEDVEIDEVSDDVNDDASKNVVNQGNIRGANINGNPVSNYFDSTTGVLLSNAGNTLTFGGDFYNASYNYSNFIINRAVTINANATDKPTLHDMGFELVNADSITLNGITFDITAPSGQNCYAINAENVNNTYITNNVITYTCNYQNAANYNYAVRVVGGENVSVSGNNITANLPLKDVDFTKPFPSIYTDLVAGVAVQSSSKFRFTNNSLYVKVTNTSGYYPTLDSLIIVDSPNAYIANNNITEIDPITDENTDNFLYAVDVYTCYNITIDNNKIDLNSEGGNLTLNGTGAAYGIQLTGSHTGVVISNNNITTANNGPNLGIYSQNYLTNTNLKIYGNNINVTGKAGTHPWALVSGMELQDNYAEVYSNVIHVTNTAGYNSNYCAYGISYSQSTPNSHTYAIYNNTVVVENGTYAVFLDGAVNSEVYENCLDTTVYCCDNAVYLPGSTNNYYDNYCSQCPNCPNCPNC